MNDLKLEKVNKLAKFGGASGGAGCQYIDISVVLLLTKAE